MKKEIEIINRIIVESIIHGADGGGSYDSNGGDLTAAINEWLTIKDLSSEYIVKRNVEVHHGYGLWIVPQIVPIVDIDDLNWLENLG